MSDNINSQILGASLSAVILPAAAGEIAGINFFHFVVGFVGLFLGLNIIALTARFFYLKIYQPLKSMRTEQTIPPEEHDFGVIEISEI